MYLCQIVNSQFACPSIHICKSENSILTKKLIRSFCEFFIFQQCTVSLSFEVFILSALGVTLLHTRPRILSNDRVFFPEPESASRTEGRGTLTHNASYYVHVMFFGFYLTITLSLSYVCLSLT